MYWVAVEVEVELKKIAEAREEFRKAEDQAVSAKALEEEEEEAETDTRSEHDETEVYI